MSARIRISSGEIPEEERDWPWLNIFIDEITNKVYIIRVKGIIGGYTINYAYRISGDAISNMFLKLQYHIGAATQEKKGRTWRLGYGPGAYQEAMTVIMYLAAVYRVRKNERIKRIVECFRGLTGFEPGFRYLTDLILELLPKEKTPPEFWSKALDRVARIIRAYCGV